MCVCVCVCVCVNSSLPIRQGHGQLINYRLVFI